MVERVSNQLMRLRPRALKARRSFWPALVALSTVGVACDGGEPDVPGAGQRPGAQAPASSEPPIPAPHACQLSVTELAIYQGVKIPLASDSQSTPDRTAPIIAGRQALVRAFVRLPDGAEPGHARARLVLAGTDRTISATTKLVAASSSDADLESTFNFSLGGDLIAPETRLSVELEFGKACGTQRPAVFPADGPVSLGARPVGALKVVLVPIRYDADGSGRLPDVSPEQLQVYERTLRAMYPIADLDLRVHDEVATEVTLGRDAGWTTLLDQLRELRVRDAAAADIYYYGLVAPDQSFVRYCLRACTAGLSYLAERRSALQQVGVGVGFGGTSGQNSADTLAHELGHQHGRKHAPCEVRAMSVDESYPYEGGRLGVWGFDFRSNTLLNPANHRDVMSYCGPQWLSDYTFSALAERRASFTTGAREVGATAARAGSFRVLLADGRGGAAWGRPLGGAEPAGRPEPATVLDATGRTIAEVTVLRTELADGEAASILVPTPLPGWAQIQVAGAAPLSFAATSRSAALRELRAGRSLP